MDYAILIDARGDSVKESAQIGIRDVLGVRYIRFQDKAFEAVLLWMANFFYPAGNIIRRMMGFICIPDEPILLLHHMPKSGAK